MYLIIYIMHACCKTKTALSGSGTAVREEGDREPLVLTGYSSASCKFGKQTFVSVLIYLHCKFFQKWKMWVEKVCLFKCFYNRVSGFGHMFSLFQKLIQICDELQLFNFLDCFELIEKAETASRVSFSPALFMNVFKRLGFFVLKDGHFRILTWVWSREMLLCICRNWKSRKLWDLQRICAGWGHRVGVSRLLRPQEKSHLLVLWFIGTTEIFQSRV